MLESSTNANVNNTHIHAFSFITIAQMSIVEVAILVVDNASFLMK